MMPRSADQLLLPVNPIFIIVSLLLAFGVNVLPIGRTPWMPDLVALTLAFWSVHQPRRVGLGIADAARIDRAMRSSAMNPQRQSLRSNCGRCSSPRRYCRARRRFARLPRIPTRVM